MKLRSVKRERGVVLAISLFVLLIISVLAASTFSNLSSQEKMSGNFREQNRVFEAANSAVQDLWPSLLLTNVGEEVTEKRSRALPDRYDVDSNGDGTIDTDLDVELEICFSGAELAPGSDEDYRAYTFEVAASSTYGRGASVGVRQAGYVVVEATEQTLTVSCPGA